MGCLLYRLRGSAGGLGCVYGAARIDGNGRHLGIDWVAGFVLLLSVDVDACNSVRVTPQGYCCSGLELSWIIENKGGLVTNR